MNAKSTKSKRPRKAAIGRLPKPYHDLPLTPHPSGDWQEKIRGKIHYFGRWGRIVNGKMQHLPDDGWKEALQLYKAQADDLHAGRTPRAKSGELTLGFLGNHFLSAKLRRLGISKTDIEKLAEMKTTQWLPFLVEKVGTGSRRMSPRMCVEYKNTVDRLISTFGKSRLLEDLRPDDFAELGAELTEQYGPVRRGNEIQKVRTVFKYALDNELTTPLTTFTASTLTTRD